MDRSKTAAEARWLMKPNLSRDALSLAEAAKHVKLTPTELDLLLWETNGGRKRAPANRSTYLERQVRYQLRRAQRELDARRVG
jgi:hypothetical protein